MNERQEDWFAMLAVIGIVGLFAWYLTVVIL